MTAPLDDVALDRIFREARTRNGWQDKPIPEGVLKQLYDLTKFGPTSANASPARFVFVTSREGKARLGPLMSEGNQKALKAPCIAIVGYDLDFPAHMPRLFPHNPDAANWFGAPDSAQRQEAAFRNGTLQGAYLITAARALGPVVGGALFSVAGADAPLFAAAVAVAPAILLSWQAEEAARRQRHRERG